MKDEIVLKGFKFAIGWYIGKDLIEFINWFIKGVVNIWI